MAKGVEFPKISKTIQDALKSSVIRSGIKSKYPSLKEFGKHLKANPSFLTMSDKKGLKLNLSAELLKSSKNSYHVILYDHDLISKFDDGNVIFIDSTFKVRPDIKHVSQFMTIMAKIHNVVSSTEFIDPLTNEAETAKPKFWANRLWPTNVIIIICLRHSRGCMYVLSMSPWVDTPSLLRILRCALGPVHRILSLRAPGDFANFQSIATLLSMNRIPFTRKCHPE